MPGSSRTNGPASPAGNAASAALPFLTTPTQPARPGPGAMPPPGLAVRATAASAAPLPLAPRASLDQLRTLPDGPLPVQARSQGSKSLAAPPGSIASFVGLGTGHRPQLGDVVGALRQPGTGAAPGATSPASSLAHAAVQALHPQDRAAVEAATQAAREHQRELVHEALGWAGSARAGTVTALRQAMQTLFERLDAPVPARGSAMPDALGADVIAHAAHTLFADPSRGGAEAAAQALQGLAQGSAATLLQRATDALAGTTAHADPVLHLAAHLAAAPGGQQRLSRLLGEPGLPPQRQEPLMAGLMAWSEHQQLVSQGVPADDPRLLLVRQGAGHAHQLLGQPDGLLPEEALSRGDSHMAYQALRKGLVDQTAGSTFQRANRWLDKVSDEWLQHAAFRNERAASGMPGSVTNAVTLLIPGGPDGKTMPLRKSSVLAATRAAVQAGLLLPEQQAVAALDASAARLRGRLASPQALPRTGRSPTSVQSLESLLAGVLDKLDLGTGARPKRLSGQHLKEGVLGSTLDKLGKTLFKEVEASLPPGALATLGPAFNAEWQQLSTSHPNATHVLGFLTEHLRHRETALPDGQASAPQHRLSLLERANQADALAGPARQALQGAAQAATHEASADGTVAALVAQIQASLERAVPASSLRPLDAKRLDGVIEQIHAALNRLPDAGAPEKPVRTALEKTGQAVEALRRQAELDGLEAHIADLIAVRGDLRTPRDLAAMMEATVRRMDTDTRFQIQDQRETGLSATKLLKHVPFVNIVAEGFKYMNRSLSINMGSHGMEIFIGQTDGKNATGGVNLRAGVPGLDAVLDAIPGLEAQLQIGSQHGYASSSGEGVSLRLQGVDDDTHAHRLAFGSLLSDLAQAQSLVGPGNPYPDVLSALLDRHPGLSVSTSENQDTTHTGQTQASAALGVDLSAVAGLLGKLPVPHIHLPHINLKLPKIPLPKVHLPKVKLPQVHLPLLSVPDIKLPEIRLPDIHGPHINLPDINLPDININLPSIDLPEVHLPDINLPALPILPLPDFEPSRMWYAGVGGSLGSHSERAANLRSESGGTLQVNEYKLTARQNVDVAAQALHLERGRGLYSAGGSQTLRVVSNEGSVLPDKTQSIQRFSNAKAFRQAVEADPDMWVALLVAQDTGSERSEAGKQAAAHQRLHQLLQEASRSGQVKLSSNEIGSGGTSNTRTESEFQIVKGLTSEAARLWDDMEAAARQCDNRQDAAGAQALRNAIGGLLNDARNWTAQDLCFGTQSMAEQVVRPFLLVPVVGRRATGSGQSTHVPSRLKAAPETPS